VKRIKNEVGTTSWITLYRNHKFVEVCEVCVKEDGVGLSTIANCYRGFLVISIDSHLPIIRPSYVCSDCPPPHTLRGFAPSVHTAWTCCLCPRMRRVSRLYTLVSCSKYELLLYQLTYTAQLTSQQTSLLSRFTINHHMSTYPCPEPDKSNLRVQSCFFKAVFNTLSYIITTGCGLDDRGSVPASYPVGTAVSLPGGEVAGAWSWPTTHVRIMPRSRTVDLYLHSLIRLYGVAIN
jgi:hypothetical protein